MTMHQFEYQIGDGTITLPLLNRLTMGDASATLGKSLTEATIILVERYLEGDELERFHSMPQTNFAAFVLAWREASGVSVGESKAS